MTIPLIKDGRQLYKEFIRIIDSIADDKLVGGSINRVALYTQFFSVMKTHEEALSALGAVIPTRYRPEILEGEDFILQINKPFSRMVWLA